MNLVLVMLPFCSAYLDWPINGITAISVEEAERRFALVDTVLMAVGFFVIAVFWLTITVVFIVPNARRARLARQTVVALEDKC